MESIVQLDATSLASFSVFLAMGCLCLAFSVYFCLKRRGVRKLAKNLTVNVFDKTFNVFDVDREKKTIDSFAFFFVLSPLVAFALTFVFVFVVILNLMTAGLLLGLIILTLSMGLMMMEEAFEVRKSSNTFIKAVGARKGFGAGDLAIMSMVHDASRRLVNYYLLLAGMFFAAFFAMPYVFPVAFTTFTYVVGMMVWTANSAQIFSPILTAFAFALASVAVFFAAKKIKAAILGFGSADTSLSAFSASMRGKMTYEKLGDVLEWKPEEETW